MNVGSLLEIYTTMYGWALFDLLYSLFNMTGLLFYPFLMSLYRNWKEPYLSQDDKPAAVTSQKRVQFSVISMLGVLTIAVVPVIPVQLNDLSYSVSCTTDDGEQKEIQSERGGSTGSTYDTNFSLVQNVQMPIIWWAALSFSSGLNYAVTASFPCFEDIKGLDQQLRNLTIKDQTLRQEYFRFANECFLPAKSKYINSIKGGQYSDYVALRETAFYTTTVEGSSFRRYNQSDPYFIGSHFYLLTPSFYSWEGIDPATCETSAPGGCAFQANGPVTGWAYNAARDVYSADEMNNPPPGGLVGKPRCDEWWSDPLPRGLKQKILNSIEPSNVYYLPNDTTDNLWQNVWTGIKEAYSNVRDAKYTQSEIEDLMIRRYVQQDPPEMLGGQGGNDFINTNSATFTQQFESDNSWKVGALLIPAALAGVPSTARELADSLRGFYLTMFVAKSAAPMVQAILLMMIYAMLMIYLVMSEYEIDAVFTALFLVIAVKFFTPLWAFADYLDARLFVSMYPDASLLGGVITHGMNRLLLDMVLTALIIVAPMILLFLIGLAGVNARGASQAVGDMTNPIAGAGRNIGSKTTKG